MRQYLLNKGELPETPLVTAMAIAAHTDAHRQRGVNQIEAGSRTARHAHRRPGRPPHGRARVEHPVEGPTTMRWAHACASMPSSFRAGSSSQRSVSGWR